MFRSQLSGKVSDKRVSPVRVVIETRPRKYENYNPKTKQVKISYGSEIVREIIVLPEEVVQADTLKVKSK